MCVNIMYIFTCVVAYYLSLQNDKRQRVHVYFMHFTFLVCVFVYVCAGTRTPLCVRDGQKTSLWTRLFVSPLPVF